jgi:hypothetical protein
MLTLLEVAKALRCSVRSPYSFGWPKRIGVLEPRSSPAQSPGNGAPADRNRPVLTPKFRRSSSDG